MDGPGHYREAERLLNLIKPDTLTKRTPTEAVGVVTAIGIAALAHSNLANAVAAIEDMESGELRPGWARIVDEHWA